MEGVIDRFETERGFGFIRCDGRSVFFHVRDFRGSAQPPAAGMAVVFEEIHVGTKGPRAVAVRPKLSVRSATAMQDASPLRPAPRAVQRPQTSGSAAAVLMLVWLGLLAWAGWQRRLPVPVLLALPLLNLATFMAYWLDKHAALQRRWRTSEQTLHLMALVGGWPGAWWGQQLLRHKSVKASFRQMYWFTVAMNLVATAAWVLWRPQV